MYKKTVVRCAAFVGILCVAGALVALPAQHARAAVPGWSGYMKVMVSEYGSSPSDEEVVYHFDGTATTATDYLWEQDVTWSASYSRIDLPYITCPDGPTPVSSASGSGSGAGTGVIRVDFDDPTLYAASAATNELLTVHQFAGCEGEFGTFSKTLSPAKTTIDSAEWHQAGTPFPSSIEGTAVSNVVGSDGVVDVATTVTWVLTRQPDADHDGQPDATDPCPTDFNNQCDTSARPTSLAVTAATGDFADSTTVSAILTSGGARVSDKSVTLTLNHTETCTATTDATGTASCAITPAEPAGSYDLDASFAGDNGLTASTATGTFVVSHEETALSYTGATAAVNGMPFTMTATLTTDDPAAGTALSARQVTFALGTGGTAQSCTGNTDLAGSASCTITPVSQPVGPASISARFAGDAFYQPATATSTATVFLPPATGAFVIGNLSATSGKPVNFWGGQWSAANKLTGGTAPAAFKGFANSPTALTCGSAWTTGTGNSSYPPTAIPPVINVIVADRVVQNGSTVSGTARHIVQVQVSPGYGPDPGRPGWGTVVGAVC